MIFEDVIKQAQVRKGRIKLSNTKIFIKNRVKEEKTNTI